MLSICRVFGGRKEHKTLFLYKINEVFNFVMSHEKSNVFIPVDFNTDFLTDI